MRTCKRGHPRIPENTYTRPAGHSQCRPCKIASDAASGVTYRATHREEKAVYDAGRREEKAAYDATRYQNLSGYEYNLMLLRHRRSKALVSMAERHGRGGAS